MRAGQTIAKVYIGIVDYCWLSIVDDMCRFLTAVQIMTYRHKREKCAQETKEILESVLKAEKEEYGCLDCAETVRVGNPMEKILSEELPQDPIKSQAEAIMEEVQIDDLSDQVGQVEDLETYVAPEEVISNDADKSSERLKKKKRSYVEFRKDYRG